MRFNPFMIGLVSLFSCTILFAASSSTPASAVLEPGSKIVAGDSKKNEFFILAKNETMPLQTVSARTDAKTTKKKIATPYKITLKQLVTKKPNKHLANKKQAKKIKLAMHKAMTKKWQKKKTSLPIKMVAKNKKKHIVTYHLAKKKKNSPIKLASHTRHHKGKNKALAVKV